VCQDGTVYIGRFRFGLENGEGEKVYRVAENDVESKEMHEKGVFAFGILDKEIS